MRRALTLALAVTAVALAAGPGPAQVAPRRGATAARPPAWPFGAGERAEYEVRFGPLRVGTATMEIAGVDTVRGRPAFHSVMRVRGGTLFYKVDDRYESWWDTATLASYRHRQKLDEGRRERERLFEIYPDEGFYTRDNSAERLPTVPQPLDDGSFFYFVRTIALQPGRSYAFDRYFRPDRNPVVIRVVRREKVTVPAGTFDAVVIQPQIKTRGIFGENGRAEIWLSDDDRRVMLQMQTRLKFGSLNLYLKSYRPPAR